MLNVLDMIMLLIPTIAICYHAIKLWSIEDDDIKEIKHVAYITLWMVAVQIDTVLGYAL